MAEDTASASSSVPADPPPRITVWELTFAYLLLRLWIGLRLFFSGLEKFKETGIGATYSMEAYRAKMEAIAGTITENSFLPSWATNAYAMPLGFVLIAVGVLVLIGLFNRLSLLLAGLTFISLAFGLMVLPDDEGALNLGLHVGLVVAALALVRHNRFAITRW